MAPRLRAEEDRLAVVEGLNDGAIDAIATDHAPHAVVDEETELDHAANGIIGLETALGLGVMIWLGGAVMSGERPRHNLRRPAHHPLTPATHPYSILYA